jgi:hypothetical protein
MSKDTKKEEKADSWRELPVEKRLEYSLIKGKPPAFCASLSPPPPPPPSVLEGFRFQRRDLNGLFYFWTGIDKFVVEDTE